MERIGTASPFHLFVRRMTDSIVPDWLHWARQIQAISQSGLTFADNDYDRKRYATLHALAEEIFAAQTGADAARVSEWFAVQPGYVTPKVDVRGACFRNGQILLVREKADGKWCLPGGWADVEDVPSQAAEREVLEEAGFTCAARKVVGVFDANRGGEPFSAYHAFKIIFLCEIIGGAPPPDHEILEVGFFAREALPPLSSNRTSAHQLEECFRHLDQPDRATAFD
jgi:ADP-ribose pyrophosphatase YjhB (NUDIX family)